ncbi:MULTISPECIES: glutamic-type intramembrane protease PrsW [Brevibacillus]|jgi:RsiW-degrading membrane proteinase PrsW (M82 family)|uniref:Protease PrsW n=1 Tax=Brevibacillus parabrevis TaxID=54914 RepID=A0A4Y3PMY5_BREPA|nr:MULTISPECIES: glutamic-type intramembrane protease PrsW [Brevibacillus]KZE55437.1 peptidase [Brevibacillus parabrevis]MBU8712124.1 intramembrane metalloprotease PrsW [Brevibacillus parabrevis]MDH6349192.1 RsiW-degrading membrane proteinase PrsW (M82 family) [Brevibacillus sp. 1238]MDR5001207.1 glutamic-type intramembrane protease PrsW [Brevibacillus parabrevis]MED2257536.1 glutamic-type intramembrane protease PrsW [Brevibacillus parabrevis]
MIAMIGAAIAPGIAIMSYFYLRDSLEPEPISMVIRSFIFGMLLVIPIMVLQYIMQNEWNWRSGIVAEIIQSAVVEEFFKWMVIFFTVYKHVEFDEPYDGIVYAVAVSLGFATLENLFYLIINGMNIAFWRAFLPVSSHALFAVWMGYYLGRAKFSQNSKQEKTFLWLSIVLPIGLHALYNAIFLSIQNWLVVIVPFMLILWWQGLKKVQRAHEYGSKNLSSRPQ